LQEKNVLLRLSGALAAMGMRKSPGIDAVAVWSDPGFDARGLSEQLDETVRLATEVLRCGQPEHQLWLVIVRDLAEAHRVAAVLNVTPLPDHATGCYIHSCGVAIVLNGPQMMITSCHETVHWLVSGYSPNCPPLLDEGLAQFLSEAVMRRRMKATLLEYYRAHGAATKGRLGSAMRREARLKLRSQERGIVDASSLWRIRRAVVFGGDSDSTDVRDLSYCFVLALRNGTARGGPSIEEVVRRIRASNDPQQPIRSLGSDEQFRKLWSKVVSTYQAEVVVGGR